MRLYRATCHCGWTATYDNEPDAHRGAGKHNDAHQPPAPRHPFDLTLIAATDGSEPCAQTDPELWFPEKGGNGQLHALAKTLCATCHLQAACLDYALRNDIGFGIWGGLTFRERRALKKQGDAA